MNHTIPRYAESFVNWWTEFLVAHVGALDAFSHEFGDDSLAREVFGSSFETVDPIESAWSVDNYSLSAYFDEVRSPPKPNSRRIVSPCGRRHRQWLTRVHSFVRSFRAADADGRRRAASCAARPSRWSTGRAPTT